MKIYVERLRELGEYELANDFEENEWKWRQYSKTKQAKNLFKKLVTDSKSTF